MYSWTKWSSNRTTLELKYEKKRRQKIARHLTSNRTTLELKYHDH